MIFFVLYYKHFYIQLFGMDELFDLVMFHKNMKHNAVLVEFVRNDAKKGSFLHGT